MLKFDNLSRYHPVARKLVEGRFCSLLGIEPAVSQDVGVVDELSGLNLDMRMIFT